MLEALWASMLAAVRDKGALKPALALVDVSGSMDGLPMTVAIALGLFISELAPEPWRGNMITFTERPKWFSCPATATTLEAKVAAVSAMPWGGSTNFAAALELVLAHAVNARVPADALPEVMFVLTDMQFDAADGGDATAADRIHRRFRECGYTPPHVVVWNLRACGTPIFQATTDAPGVSYMSGFSQQVLTDYMENGVLASGVDVSPWVAVQQRLNRPRLRPVRLLCASTGEGVMAGYVPPPAPTEPSDAPAAATGVVELEAALGTAAVST